MVITGCHRLTAGSHHSRPGGRAADAYHCVAVGDFSHSHMTGDTLIHTAAGQRTAQRFYHQTSRKTTSRRCALIVLKAQTIPSVVRKVFWDEKEQILSVIISNELYGNAQYVLPGSAAFL